MSKSTAAGNAGSPTGVIGLLSAGVGLAVLSSLAVSFAISFAAFLYSGPLPSYLSAGVGLSLLGFIAMPIVAALTSSYPGIVVQAQDLPALLLAGAAAVIAAQLGSEREAVAFATIASLIGVATLTTAAVLYAASRFRLGLIARFMPFPVIGGFLAATGFLLFVGALSMIVKDHVSVWHLTPLWEPGALARWLPWVVFSAGTVAVVRATESALALPLALISGGLGFYLVLWWVGMDIAEASASGLLLGPFTNDDFLSGISADIPLQADWGLILQQAPTVIAIAGISVLGLLLNASGLEVALKRDLDLNRELRSGAQSNLAAGLTGGFPGYLIIGETLLASKVGAKGISASIAVALAAAITLLFGASIVAAFPIGLAASVVAFLGIDMLYEWLWVQRRRLPRSDFAIIALILIAAALFGFIEALCVGLLAEALIFVVSYAAIDVVGLKTNGAERRSTVERGWEQTHLLTELGQCTKVYELNGYLFFGTANRLLDGVRRDFATTSPLSRVVFDLSRVTGIDTSATMAVSRLAELCQTNNAKFVICGLSERVRRRLNLSGVLEGVAVYETLNEALQNIEAELLGDPSAGGLKHTAIDEMSRAAPELDLAIFTQRIELDPGVILTTVREDEDTFYEVVRGQLRAEITEPDGSVKVVARFLPGALIGEIAVYAKEPSEGTIIVEHPSSLIRIEPDKIPDSHLGLKAAAALHRYAAGTLAYRLMRVEELVRSAGI